MQEGLESWNRIASLEPGSEAALQIKKQTGRTLEELKIGAEAAGTLFHAGLNMLSSLTK